MEKEMLGLIITCAVALLCVIVISALVKRQRNIKSGIAGEKKVAKKLKRFAVSRGFKLINGIYLPLYDKTTQIDHILIGYFGVIVVETKNYKGSVYGDLKAKKWMHVVGDDRNDFYNPIMQNQGHIDCIRNIFSKNDIYNVKIDNLVVFANKKTELYIPKCDNVIKINKLNKFLHQVKYEADNGIDIDKIYNTLMDSRATDKSLIAKHNKNEKKISKN